MNESIKYFLIILVGALLSSIVGGAFGWLIAFISPEFVDNLFYVEKEVNIQKYAFSVGMIWGIFIGAAVSGFSCFLTVIYKIARLKSNGDSPQSANQSA